MTEAPFIKRKIQQNFYVYVDTVIFTVNPDRDIHPKSRLEVAVIQRAEGAKGKFSLPGGAVQDNEKIDEAAIRVAEGEAGLRIDRKSLHQVRTYGDPGRDTRSRAIAVCHMVLLPYPDDAHSASDSMNAVFMPYRQLRDAKLLEFDHRDMIHDARQLALRLLEDTEAALSFCDTEFTMPDLRNVYEAFLQSEIDPANFRRKVEASGLVQPTQYVADTSSQRGRPPTIYRRGGKLDSPIRFRQW